VKQKALLKSIATLAKEVGVDFDLDRQGANHALYRFDDQLVTVPRHADINEVTAKAILRTVRDKAAAVEAARAAEVAKQKQDHGTEEA
jgi:mRNA interferase HicA